MERHQVLAAWIAGALVWLGAVGGMAALDDGVPAPAVAQLAEHAADPSETAGDEADNDPA